MIGTTEALLMQFGIDGPDFSRGVNGNSVPGQPGLNDLIVPWKNIGGPPDYLALFSSTSPDFLPTRQARAAHADRDYCRCHGQKTTEP